MALKKASLYAIVALLTIIGATTAQATLSPPASRYASIVIDAESGEVLYERNADLARYPASLTKIMTLYLAFEALATKKLSLTDELPVSSYAASRDPSRLDLAPGSRLKVEDAIRAITTKSANDAACIIGEALGDGSEKRFAAKMTAKAKALGLKQTTFLNASGLPEEGHMTSARDLALLCRWMIVKYPQYYSYFATDTFQFHGTRFHNQNRFLHTYYGADGIKTGFVNASGHNLAASAVRGGKRLIAVVLGGETQAWTREHTTRLLDVAYAKLDPSLVMVASNEVNSASADEEAEEKAAESATVIASVGAPSPAPAAIGSVGAPSPAPAAPAVNAATPAPNTATSAPAAPAAGTGTVATAPAQPIASPTPAAPQALPLPNATANLTAFVASSTGPRPSSASPASSPASAAAHADSAARPAASAAAPVQSATAAAARPAAAPAPVPSAASAPAAEAHQLPPPATAAPTKPVADPPAAPVARVAVKSSAPAAEAPAAAEKPVAPAAPPKSSPAPAPVAPQPPAAEVDAANTAPAVVESVSSNEVASGGDWSVQVGLFRDATVARRRGEEARRQMPLQLRGADLVVGRALDGIHVTSRLSRLSEQDARTACNELQRGRVPCVVVPPGRPLVVATN